MPAQLVIRELAPGATDQIVAIALDAWTPIYDYYRQTMGDALFLAEYPDWRAHKGDHIRHDARGEDGAHVLVAVVGKRIVGFATYTTDHSKGIGEIGNNAVLTELQGHGIGGDLHRRALDLMREAGMRYARVSTGLDPAHAPARQAYERRGFGRALPGVLYYCDLGCSPKHVEAD